MYIETVGGRTYTPESSFELTSTLNQIRNNGDIIKRMIIKGHGSEDGINIGGGEDYLTTAGNSIYIGGTDVTNLLKDVTDGRSAISLRGCFSYALAKRVQARLDGAKVYGAIRFVIGIPGTTIGIGVFY